MLGDSAPANIKCIATESQHEKIGNYCIQYNLDGSNTDGSFTVDDLNSFLSPEEILSIAKENKYFGILKEIFLFYCENVCCVYSLELPH